MRLDLDRIPAGRSESGVAERIGLELGDGSPEAVALTGVLVIDDLEGRCVVRGELDAEGAADCDRCLEEFTLRFAVPFAAVILRDAGHETDDAETLVLHQRRGEIDLSDALREAVILALPQTKVCGDDCRGLCARCGLNLNEGSCSCEDDDVDPRWEGLPD
jgi:uncharacterized protein